jgi:hypothetical protein
MTLMSGLINLALGALNIFPLSPTEHIAQWATGLGGIALAWSPARARLFGIAVLLGFGALFLWQVKESNGWFVGWWPLRMTLTGGAITFMPSSGTSSGRR